MPRQQTQLGSYIDGATLVGDGSPDNPVRVGAASSSSSGGLFAPIMSAKPTAANTGFSSWYYQFAGSTVVDSELGISMKAASSGAADSWTARARAVPAAPYSVRMLMASAQNPALQDGTVFVGWADAIGGKWTGFGWTPNYSGQNGYIFNVPSPTSNPALATSLFGGTIPLFWGGGPLWVRLTDDGTTAKIFMSRAGDTDSFYQVFSQTKAAGYLGSAGYSNFVFGWRGLNAGGNTILQSFQVE